MRKTNKRSLLAAAVAVPLAAVTLTACGETAAPQVGALGQTILLSKDKSSAIVLATYRCSGGAGAANSGLPIMWVSVKQSAKNNDPALFDGGSSAKATAWYDSHTPIVCDGKVKNAVFKIDRHSDKGVFKTTINAWLQVCLTDGKGTLATNDQYVAIR